VFATLLPLQLTLSKSNLPLFYVVFLARISVLMSMEFVLVLLDISQILKITVKEFLSLVLLISNMDIF